MNSLVSIIVPCYNQGKFLPETLDSVLAQSYKNWECIIVNDGSTDNTEEVSKRYCSKDSRIKYFYKDNGGLSSARNYGIKSSSGEFILPLDSDDKIGREYLEEAVEILNNNQFVKIVYCKAVLFGEVQGDWFLPEYSLERMLGRNIIFCTAFFRRDDYDRTKGYNENMKFGFEDWDFWLSILKLGGDVYCLDKVFFYYRIRKGSMSKVMTTENKSYLRKQIYENHKELYDSNFLNPLETFEYLSIANSYEYRLGKVVLTPIRKIWDLIR